VVSINEKQLEKLTTLAAEAGISIATLGTITDGAISVNGTNWGSITDWKEKYDTAIEKLLN